MNEFIARKGLLVLNGNLGVNTISPAARAHIVGGSTTTGIANTATTLNTRFDLANPAISLGVGYVSADLPILQAFNNVTNTSTGLLLNPFGGGVGIGLTTVPTAKLHVLGGSRLVSSGGITTPLLNLMQSNDTNGYYFSIDNALDGRMELRNDAGTTIQTWQRGTGYVGIGTASPSAPLEIVHTSGNTLVLSKTTGGSLSFKKTNATAQEWNISPSDDFSIYDITAGTQPFNIKKTSGNVGIGTISPNHLLTINNAASGGTYFGLYQSYVDGNDWRNWVIGSNNQTFGDFNILQSNATGGNPLSAGTSRFYINKLGNVGIGTTAPAAKLHVSNGAASNTQILLGPAAASGDYAYINWNNNSTVQELKIYADAGFTSFYTSATERMRISSGGDVAINTSTISWATTNRRVLEINGASTVLLGLKVGDSQKAYYYADSTDVYLSKVTAAGRLYVVNNSAGVYLTDGATSWTGNSDERLKNINSPIENATDKLMTLRPVNFSWKSDSSNKEVLGLIAQDVEKVFPQVIDIGKLPSSPDKPQQDETEYLGVRYTELIPVLVKAIQELKQEIETLKNK